ncbi:PH domain-containing protein [Haloterrigena salina]|uniref:PH domain-containing protein n=1 Tax=Haloterrigena salina TaxID=504937 RepID=UPI0012692EC7|nr:PH domain-containing protein [Haloterrigena salina]
MPLKNYLGDNEELLLSWGGKPDEDDEFFSTSGTNLEFGATDKRLIFYDDNGSFKDIEYTHISSIEAETDKEVKDISDFDDNGLLLGGLGAIVSVVGVLIEIMPILLIGIVLIMIVMFLNLEDVQKVKIITGDEMPSRVNFKTTENISGDLSKIIRDNS